MNVYFKSILSSVVSCSLLAMSPELQQDIVSRFVNPDNTVTQPVRELLIAGKLIDPSMQPVSLDEAVKLTQAHWFRRNWDYEHCNVSSEEQQTGEKLFKQLSEKTTDFNGSVDVIMVLQGVLPSSIKCLKTLAVLAHQKVAPRVLLVRGNNSLHDEQVKQTAPETYHQALEAVQEQVLSAQHSTPQNQEELVRFLINNTSFNRILDNAHVDYTTVKDLKKWAQENHKETVQKVLFITPDGQRNNQSLSLAESLQGSSYQLTHAISSESLPELRRFYTNSDQNGQHAYLRDAAVARVLYRIQQMRK